MVLNGNLGYILKKSPLSPTVLPLSSSSKDNKDEVFRSVSEVIKNLFELYTHLILRQLAKISRSTRGIVLLLCDLNMARRIMSEATRLKMTGGHFIWLWADTSSTAEFFQPTDIAGEEKANYDEFMSRKQKQQQQQYYQQPNNRRNNNNNQTRYKSMNSNRFHHIVGLRKPTGDEFMGLPPPPPPPAQSGYLKGDRHRDSLPTGQIPLRDKRKDQKRVNVGKKSPTTTRVESSSSNIKDSESANRQLNIKNINSNEFNANYYDPYSPAYRQNIDDSDFDDSTNEESNVYYDYDKINPFNVPATSAPIASTKKINGNYNNVITQPFDEEEDEKLDLDNYSEATNDSKAKRADNFHSSSFNISSHVFFHHFKDFPVGLLALRHIKMNVDRVFVRSAIRLFASTWARVEKNEEMRAAMSTTSSISSSSKYGGSNRKAFDYDEYGDMFRITSNSNNKIKNKANVNNRYSNPPVRGTRKFKREASSPQVNNATVATATDNDRSILPLMVNSSDKTIKFTNNESGLNTTQHMHSSVVEIKSNIDTISHSVNLNSLKVNSSASQAETVQHGVHSESGENNKKKIEKRQQSSWYSPSTKGGNVRNQQEKVKIVGTLQYKGGCFGSLAKADLKRSEIFAK